MTPNMQLNNQEILVSTKIRKFFKTQQLNKNLFNPISFKDRLPIKMSERILSIKKIQEEIICQDLIMLAEI